MFVLDDFFCKGCGWADEKLHVAGDNVIQCPGCGGLVARTYPRLQQVENFGALGVHHTPGRRLAKAEQERRDHYRQTRHKEAEPVSMTPRPKHFS